MRAQSFVSVVFAVMGFLAAISHALHLLPFEASVITLLYLILAAICNLTWNRHE